MGCEAGWGGEHQARLFAREFQLCLLRANFAGQSALFSSLHGTGLPAFLRGGSLLRKGVLPQRRLRTSKRPGMKEVPIPTGPR